MIRKIYRNFIPQSIRLFNRRLVDAIRFVITGNGLMKKNMLTLNSLLGMTSLEEQQFYKKSAAEASDLEGQIVDLGCWMGSTTIPLVQGINQSSTTNSSSEKVFAFDRFIWESWMDQFMPRLSRQYAPGDSFLQEAQEILKEFKGHIELIECDLNIYVWKEGSIKLLLVDAMKSEELARSIARNFFPFLIKDAFVIHQDFKHHYTPWIHLLMYRLKDYFEFFHEVENGGTVAFRLVNKIPLNVIEQMTINLCFGVQNSELDEAFVHSMNLVSENGKLSVAAAHIAHYVHSGQKELARELLTYYKETYTDTNYDLIQAEKMLAE